MGTTLKNIVPVSITKENARILRAGFGIPLLLGANNRTDQLITVFSDPADMLTAGYKSTDVLYKMAVMLMKQEYSPEVFYIGRKKGNSNCLQSISFDGSATAGTFTISVESETTAGIAYDADEATIKSALELLTGVEEVTVTGSISDDKISIEFTGVDANKDFAEIVVDVSGTTGDLIATVTKEQFGSVEESYTDVLNTIWQTNTSWFALNTADQDDDTILECAEWIESTNKMYFITSDAEDLTTSVKTDVASILKAKGYLNTVIMYHTKASTEYGCTGWIGGQLPKDAGSITWAYKPIVGLTADVLTTDQITNLKAKNVNFYEEVAGRSLVTSNAVVVGGEYIDVMRGIYWLEARVAENVFLGLINNEKVPYNQDGINYCASKVRSVLEIASTTQGFINSDYTITIPDLVNVPTDNKTNRLLEGIEFSATLTGAIHVAKITGKLSD